MQDFLRQNVWLIIMIAVWDLIWKGKALWKAAKNNQKNWFIFLMIINSAGIFPLIYLKFFSNSDGKTEKRRV